MSDHRPPKVRGYNFPSPACCDESKLSLNLPTKNHGGHIIQLFLLKHTLRTACTVDIFGNEPKLTLLASQVITVFDRLEYINLLYRDIS
jgi:hypothetical protein